MVGDPKMKVLLEVGCLPYAVGKHRFIHLINLGRKWTAEIKKEGKREGHGKDGWIVRVLEYF